MFKWKKIDHSIFVKLLPNNFLNVNKLLERLLYLFLRSLELVWYLHAGQRFSFCSKVFNYFVSERFLFLQPLLLWIIILRWGAYIFFYICFICFSLCSFLTFSEVLILWLCWRSKLLFLRCPFRNLLIRDSRHHVLINIWLGMLILVTITLLIAITTTLGVLICF